MADPCRICRAADAETGFDTYAECCSDEHTEAACLLAESIGRMIWEDEPCPVENLATHVEDAVAIISDLPHGPYEVWMLGEDDLDELRLVGSWWQGFTLFAVMDSRQHAVIFGHDPNEEGQAPPSPLGDLIAGLS